MVTVLLDDTLFVVTVKLLPVFPADTVTLAGTVATEVSLLERLTTAPPEGAAAVSWEDEVVVTAAPALPLNLRCFRGAFEGQAKTSRWIFPELEPDSILLEARGHLAPPRNELRGGVPLAAVLDEVRRRSCQQ